MFFKQARNGLDYQEFVCYKFRSMVPNKIADLHQVYATTARPRDIIKTVLTPEGACNIMQNEISNGQKIGILFGKERAGLENSDIILANSIIIGVKQNDKFARIIVISFLMMIIYYFCSNLMNTLGSNAKLPPLISTLITPIMLFSLALFIVKYKTLRRKI